jgi:hypothetical protein
VVFSLPKCLQDHPTQKKKRGSFLRFREWT